MPRTITPELLDTLSPHDPDAIHSRRDLRVINGFMRNHRWIAGQLRRDLRFTDRVLEIGAGTGELTRRLAGAGFNIHALDLAPVPEHWPAALPWHSSDLKTFQRYGDFTVFVGNLIFHHLNDDELSLLGTKLRATARVIIACEPHRSGVAQFLLRVLGPVFGASHVTLHDGHVSIAGGFSGDELSCALGLDSDKWHVQHANAWPGGYRMIATRRE